MRIRKNKYNAVRVIEDGIPFDSKREYKRYQELKLLVKAGKISGLQVHPKFMLDGPNGPLMMSNNRQATYTPDFQYLDLETGKIRTEDVKVGSTKTEAYALRKALLQNKTGLIVEEV